MALQSVFLLPFPLSVYIPTDRAPFLGRTTAAGLAFISADYRLLPPCTGHDVLEDVVDLFAFLARTPRLGSVLIDATRLAVAGSSAGGMCAFLAAIHVNPRPRAVLSIYGLGGDVFVSALPLPGHKREAAGPDFRRVTDLTCRTASHAADPALPRAEDGAVLPGIRDPRSRAVRRIPAPGQRDAGPNSAIPAHLLRPRFRHPGAPVEPAHAACASVVAARHVPGLLDRGAHTLAKRHGARAPPRGRGACGTRRSLRGCPAPRSARHLPATACHARLASRVPHSWLRGQRGAS